MKRAAWLAGTGVVVLLVLGGVLLLAANLCVQSQPMQARIRQELSTFLKMPAEVRKTTFTPWDGLRIDGVSAPGDARAEPDLNAPVRLSAASFRARIALWPLLSGEGLVVRELLFDRPSFAWVQTAAGRWRWPGSSPEPSSAQEEDGAVEDSAEPAPPPPAAGTRPAAPGEPATEPPGAPGVEKKRDAPRRLPVAVQGFKLRHGLIQLLSQRGAPIGRFEGVNLNGQLDGPEHGHGQMWFARSAWGAANPGGAGLGLAIDRFESPFTFSRNHFHISDGRGELAGGRVKLDFALRQAAAGSPFQARGALEDVALDQVLKNSGVRHDLAVGRVGGEFEWSGLTSDTSTQTGRGELRILGGELRGLPLLGTVGDALGIEELRHLRFQEARADCRLERDTLRVDPVSLVAANLRLDARGQCQLDHLGADDPAGLDLQARLTIGKAISRQLPQFIEDNFLPVATAADGSRYMDFKVSGPLANPRTDLLDRAVAKPLRNLLQSVLGGAGSDRPEKKKEKTPKAGKGMKDEG